jgi:hypothetical protein
MITETTSIRASATLAVPTLAPLRAIAPTAMPARTTPATSTEIDETTGLKLADRVAQQASQAARDRKATHLAIGTGRGRIALETTKLLVQEWGRLGGAARIITWPASQSVDEWSRVAQRIMTARADLWIMIDNSAGWVEHQSHLPTNWTRQQTLLTAEVAVLLAACAPSAEIVTLRDAATREPATAA